MLKPKTPYSFAGRVPHRHGRTAASPPSGTVPDGNLLISFCYLDTVNQQAVDWHIASLLVDGKQGAGVRYEDNLANNTVCITAIHNLYRRIERSVNCVRIKRVGSPEAL